MKLEDKFFKSFFYPFLIGVILSTLVVTVLLGSFTNNNFDKRTRQNIINAGKKNSEINFNSISILLTTKFLKIQSSLNELIHFYQSTAKKLLTSKKNHKLDTTYLKCVLDVDDDYCDKNWDDVANIAYWLVDKETNEDSLANNRQLNLQLIAYSNIIQNLDAIHETTYPVTYCYYFYFEQTELYTSYPLINDCGYGFLDRVKDYNYKNTGCLKETGEYYDVYKVKCENFFLNMLKAKTNAFDNNYKSNQNKTIFVTNFYNVIDYEYLDWDIQREFSMCIEFDDPITNGTGYICVDVVFEEIVSSLDNFNSKMVGYFYISNVGFDHVFYFPKGTITPKTSTENIYKWGKKYKLDEKTYFHENIRKSLTSNYIDQIGDSIYDEVFVNGNNANDQYFYINEEKYRYSIYPITLQNIKGQREHLLSIIYIYRDQVFFDKIYNDSSSIIYNIILELIIFIIFGSAILYIIYLTFNTLVKYIVIPIKNVNYMLKGINIGGTNRLNYLKFLKKKEEENLEKLESIYKYEKEKMKQNTTKQTEENKDLINNITQITKNNHEKRKSKYELQKALKKFNEYNKKYDEISSYIEKEYHFYDFDEQLLLYRALEIENLVKSLIDLKGAKLLTSQDRELENVINYSSSEKIFSDYKNKEGVIICQSNIGNMQSQLKEFDKAIYHLALSLQDNKLKKFLHQNINDEYDEGDTLLNKLSYTFNIYNNQEKNNILLEKQMNNYKNTFSKKLIGILINTRYCRLIYAYYMFFKNIQKLQKSNDDKMTGQFGNTTFHTINYYHKIIIQYIYLSYAKNDLVKMGESILNYLEFLIKFKFKISSDDEDYIKIKNENSPEYLEKQEYKKKIFNKIMNWFNLFDDYITYVTRYSSLSDTKCIVEDYSHSLNTENFVFNLESQTAFMFRINIQKSNFLKGKFCFYCQNYIDALFYFISASKKDSIVIDGLIKKKSLKYVYKLLSRMNNYYEKLGINNLNIDKELNDYKNYKKKQLRIGRRITNRALIIFQENDVITFGDKVEKIKNNIIKDINEYNKKKEKDLIVLIDFNIYTKKVEHLHVNTNKIDAFIEETNAILNNYLSASDRFCSFIYENNYKLICPFMCVNQIDNENFAKQLIYYKNILFEKNKIIEDYNLNFNEYFDYEFDMDINEHSQPLNDSSYETSESEEKILNQAYGFVEALNYINYYSRMKEGVKNDRYIIVFTDILNMKLTDNTRNEKIFGSLTGDKEAIFLLVGKNNEVDIKNEKNNFVGNDDIIEKLILSKFGDKSETICFENMKKIKAILSNNKVIKNEIIFPNEIY